MPGLVSHKSRLRTGQMGRLARGEGSYN
jgi:hypothetical protein